MKYTPDFVAKVREYADQHIVEIITERIELSPQKGKFVALCPFHQEKTGSFTVNPSRKAWHCFGCGVGGDAIEFVIKFDGVTFHQALAKLASRGNIPLPGNEETPEEREKKKMYHFHLQEFLM